MTNDIVVVDREPNILARAADAARQEGYAVTTAATGTEALPILQTVSPWLLITSEYLPDMTARQMLDAFRAFPTQQNCDKMPFGLILLVARTSVRWDDFGGFFLPNVLLSKPFNPLELRLFIRRLCPFFWETSSSTVLLETMKAKSEG